MTIREKRERKMNMIAKTCIGCRRAISPVIAALILASVLCIIVFAASNLANDIVSAQVEDAQFEQAKYVMVSLDKLIKRIIHEPKSSGYVKTSFWKVTPYFERNVGNLTLEAPNLEITIPINIVKIKGGPRVSISVEENLVGNESLIVRDAVGSLGNVKVYQLSGSGAYISLDYARLRCINTGRNISYYNGTGYEPYNTIEITLVKIEFRDFMVSEQASFIAKNIEITPIQRDVGKGNFAIIVKRTDLNKTESITLVDLGGDPNHRTLINAAIITIEVSILGGI